MTSFIDLLENPMFDNPTVSMSEQPEQTVRFRYETEIRKGAHTEIKGCLSSKDYTTYPSVKITNCYCPIVVSVSLVTENNHLMAHCHKLYDARDKKKPAKGSELLEFSDDGVCHIRIEASDLGCHVIGFPGLGVLAVTATEGKDKLREIKKQSLLWECQKDNANSPIEIPIPDERFTAEQLKEVDKRVKQTWKSLNQHAVVLKFEVKILGDNIEDWESFDPVYSMPIRNAKSKDGAALEVQSYAPTKSQNENEKMLIVLKQKVAKEQIEVRFFNELWSDLGVIESLHHGVVMDIRIPKCPKGVSAVFFQIYKKDMSALSEQHTFLYVVEDMETRKRKNPQDSTPESGPSPAKQQIRDFVTARRNQVAAMHSPLNGSDGSSISVDGGACTSSGFDSDSDLQTDACRAYMDPAVSVPPKQVCPPGRIMEPFRKAPICVGPIKEEPMEATSIPFNPVQKTTAAKSQPLEPKEEPKSTSESEGESAEVRQKDQVKVFMDKFRQRTMGFSYRIAHELAFGRTDKELVDMLLDTLPQLATVGDQVGDTPLHNAILKGQTDTAVRFIDILLKHGPRQLNRQNSSKHTPLILCPNCDVPDSLGEKLVQAGARLDLVDNHQCSVFHYAVRQKRIGLLNFLLKEAQLRDQMAVVNLLDGNQYSALHYAVLGGSIESFRLLLAAGADPNVCSERDRETPLHLAVLMEQTEMVREFINRPNIDLNAALTDGRSALRLAIECESDDMIGLLLEKGAEDLISDEEAREHLTSDEDEGISCEEKFEAGDMDVDAIRGSEEDGKLDAAMAESASVLEVQPQLARLSLGSTQESVKKEISKTLSGTEIKDMINRLFPTGRDRKIQLMLKASDSTLPSVFLEFMEFTEENMTQLPECLREMGREDVAKKIFFS